MPRLGLCISRYTGVPRTMPAGITRVGYVNHWTLYDDIHDDTWIVRSPVEMKHGDRYHVNMGRLRQRIEHVGGGEDDPIMLEVETASRHGHPYVTPRTDRSRAALNHVRVVRDLLGTVTPRPIVAEYTNAFPARLDPLSVAMPHAVERNDRDGHEAAGDPDCVTSSIYGRGVIWQATVQMRLPRMRRVAGVRPIAVVISHIVSGSRWNTPDEMAQQVRVLAPRLRDRDWLIYWASDRRPYDTHLRPFADAVRDAMKGDTR